MREENNHSLGQALRGLPLQSPDGDMWSQLAAELTPARTRRRTWPYFAAAAAVLIAVAAMLTMPHRPATVANVASSNNASTDTSEPANVATTDTSNQLTALQSRSRELEQWLHQTAGAAAPLPGRDLAAAMEIENLISVVDVQLAAPNQGDEGKLWRRRVDLLEDLTALRYSNYRLAESDGVANGQPATWIN
jgi:hypothetical protein